MDAADAEGRISPNIYDVILTDISHDTLLGDIAERLDVNYLEESQETAPIVNGVMTVSGILFGSMARPMVNVVIFSTKYKKPVNVIFLVDTGCPSAYVCESAMVALGFRDPFPSSFSFRVAGSKVGLEAHLSTKGSHFSDINLMGAEFLTNLRARVSLDYKSRSVVLEFAI
jgi:hypothetical protein